MNEESDDYKAAYTITWIISCSVFFDDSHQGKTNLDVNRMIANAHSGLEKAFRVWPTLFETDFYTINRKATISRQLNPSSEGDTRSKFCRFIIDLSSDVIEIGGYGNNNCNVTKRFGFFVAYI